MRTPPSSLYDRLQQNKLLEDDAAFYTDLDTA